MLLFWLLLWIGFLIQSLTLKALPRGDLARTRSAPSVLRRSRLWLLHATLTVCKQARCEMAAVRTAQPKTRT